jgi:translation initiation factor IF-2
VSRAPSAAVVAAALGLAVLAPAATAQDPAALLEAAAQVPGNPPETVISDRYREIETVVTEALPAAPAPEAAAPPPAPAAPPPAPEPEYHPEPQQYHSEKPAEVTVTQANPQNVNVSIRINSPGDDGPVTQINSTGSVSAPAPERAQPEAPQPPSPAAVAPSAPAGPDTWEWIWTSACFGGEPGGGAPVATASARWVWRWSCGDAPLPALADGVGEIAEEMGAVLGPGEHPAWPSMPAGVPGGELVSALARAPARERRPAPRPAPERRGSGEAAGPAAYERPPPGARSAPAAHGGLLGTGASRPTIAASVDQAPPARPKAQARPLDGAGSQTPSGDGGGLAAGPATGHGGGVSLLLAGWLAVLASALGLALPRLWLRRWSGPAWRIPWPRSTRLERPG